MSATFIVIALGVLAVVGFMIAAPFLFGARRQEQTNAAQHLRELEEQLLQLIQGVQDLDSDYDMQKIADDDYVTQRKLLIGRGVSTLIQLDDAQAELNQVDQELETLIQDYRRQSA